MTSIFQRRVLVFVAMFFLIVHSVRADETSLQGKENSGNKKKSSRSFSYITENTIAATLIRPKQILGSKTVKPYADYMDEYLDNYLMTKGRKIYRNRRLKDSFVSVDDLVSFFREMKMRSSEIKLGDLEEVAIMIDRKNLYDSSWSRPIRLVEEKKAIAKYPVADKFKKISDAFNLYHRKILRFPKADGDGLGKHTGLSWRVHLLPSLGKIKLFREFHLDDPWDSTHNKKLISKMPDVFKSPGVKEDGKTSIHVFTGERTLFTGGKEGTRIRDVIDGTSNTIRNVLAGPDKADYWTKPGGIPFSDDDPKNGLGKIEDNTLIVCMASGDVRKFSDFNSIPDDQFGFLVKRNDGQHLKLTILNRKTTFQYKMADLPTIVLVNSKKWNKGVVTAAFFKRYELGNIQGVKSYAREGYAICFPDDYTLIYSHEKCLSEMLANQKNGNSITEKFNQARKKKIDLSVITNWSSEKELVNKLVKQNVGLLYLMNPLVMRRQLYQSKQVGLYGLHFLPQIKEMSLNLNVSGNDGIPLINIEINPENKQALESIHLILNQYCYRLQQAVKKYDFQSRFKNNDFEKFAHSITKDIKFVEKNSLLHLDVPVNKEYHGISKAFKPELDRSINLKNVKRVLYALNSYSDTLRGFPRPGGDSYGDKTGFSWRVYLLRFIGHTDLYNEFHLDEPWDSDHNKKLISKMPGFYRTPGVTEEGKTSLHVFTGEKTPLNREMKARKRFYVYSGMSTILIVQAGKDKAEFWTKPGGLPFIEDDPIKALGKIEGDEFIAGFFNRWPRVIKKDISPKLLSELIKYQKRKKKIIWSKSGQPEFIKEELIKP